MHLYNQADNDYLETVNGTIHRPNKDQNMLSGSNEPVFLIDTLTGEILEANDTAVLECNPVHPTGKKIDSLIFVENDNVKSAPAYFCGHWYHIFREPFIRQGRSITKIKLLSHPAIPNRETISTAINMISVLIHRLRSPLTGIQGYLDLLGNSINEKNEHQKVDNIREGLDYFQEMLEELECLYYADMNNKYYSLAYHTCPKEVIEDLLSSYPKDIQNRVDYCQMKTDTKLKINPLDLKRILGILIKNAIEHTTENSGDLFIEVPDSRKITITNGGNPIPAGLRKRIFQPFVTTKSNCMGIGLTIAQLLAGRERGLIFLSNNDAKKGISFTFCLPPE